MFCKVFTIERVINTIPFTFLLKDFDNKLIKGCFFEQELLKTKNPDINHVEKTFKKGDKVFVKWLGVNYSHNS